MMYFARLIRIFRQTLYYLYSFVTSIASIKASIAFILFLSVFLVLLPGAIHTESDTKIQIQNTESENDTKYSRQPTTFINDTILNENVVSKIIEGIFYSVLVPFLFLFSMFCWTYYNLRLIQVYNDVFDYVFDDDLDDLQQNNNQNNRWIHMNGPIRGRRVARVRNVNE